MSGSRLPLPLQLLLWFGLARLLAALLTASSLVPDEYYQAAEPALQLVRGGAVLTWEWARAVRIRSLLPIIPLAATMRILRELGLDGSAWAVAVAPRLSQSAIAFIGDALYIKLAAQLAGKSSEILLLLALFHLCSWSGLYCLSRSLINSTETSLQLLVMHETNRLLSAPVKSEAALDKKAEYLLTLLCVAAYIRPTSILISAPFVAIFAIFAVENDLILRWFNDLLKPLPLLRKLSLAAAPLLVCALVDSLLFQRFDEARGLAEGLQLTLPFLNFMKFNVYYNMSAIFGVKSALWNFKEGLPTVLGLYTPLLIVLLLKLFLRSTSGSSSNSGKNVSNNSSNNINKKGNGNKSHFESLPPLVLASLLSSLLYPALLTLFSSHFEFRFLLVCLPGLHIFLGYYYHYNFLSSAGKPLENESSEQSKRRKRILLLGLLFAVQIAFASYMSLFHQSGPERAIFFLNSEFEQGRPLQKIFSSSSLNQSHSSFQSSSKSIRRLSVYLLAPCYSFPGRAHFLKDIAVNYPRCPIEAKLQKNGNYQLAAKLASNSSVDESYFFEQDPVKYLMHLLEKAPSRSCENDSCEADPYLGIYSPKRIDVILTFDGYVNTTVDLELRRNNFTLLESFHHAHFRYDYDDPIIKKRVLLYVHNRKSLKKFYNVP